MSNYFANKHVCGIKVGVEISAIRQITSPKLRKKSSGDAPSVLEMSSDVAHKKTGAGHDTLTSLCDTLVHNKV